MRNMLGGALLIALTAIPQTQSAKAAEYVVGVVQSLTGSGAFVGASVMDGALLAVEDINAKGLLGPGNTLKALTQDDTSDRGQAITSVNLLAARPEVLAVMGPTAGGVALAGGQAAADKKIIAYATTNSNEYTRIGQYNFALTAPPQVTIPTIGKYAMEKLKVKNCLIVGIIDNEAYVSLHKLFADYITERGSKMVAVEAIKTADSDFAAVSTKVASRDDIDCVFVSAPPATGANLISQLRQAGLKSGIRILGHNTFSTPDYIKVGGAAVEGTYFMGDWVPGGSSPEGKRFVEIFEKKYGRAPDNWAPIGYSGMMVLANAIKAAGTNVSRDSLRDALAKTKDFDVIIGEGKYSFAENRTPIYGMNVLTVENGKFVAAP